MPGTMNGLGLAQLVHVRWPAIRLLTSGRQMTSGHQSLSRERLPEAGQFMRKPWTESELIGKVNGPLGA